MHTNLIVNICFHGIGTPGRLLEPGEERYWIHRSLYEDVLDEVAGRADVRISFDDGNQSDLDIALDELVRRGMTATFFVLAGRLNEPGSLSTADVRELREHGMSIGTHGMNHRSWRGMDQHTQLRELVTARQWLAQASSGPIDEAALPMGQYDRTALGALRALGYRAVFTSDRRPAQHGLWMQPRYSLRRGDTIDSIRSTVLTRTSPLRRVKSEAVGLYKRFR